MSFLRYLFSNLSVGLGLELVRLGLFLARILARILARTLALFLFYLQVRVARSIVSAIKPALKTMDSYDFLVEVNCNYFPQ